MKVLEFRVVDTHDKEENPTIGLKQIKHLDKGGYEDFMERVDELLEKIETRKFDWREELKRHISDGSWQEGHKLTTPEDVQIALDVQKVLASDDESMEVDNSVADYLCEVAENLQWLPNSNVETLSALLEFKKFFAGVAKDEGSPTPKKEKKAK